MQVFPLKVSMSPAIFPGDSSGDLVPSLIHDHRLTARHHVKRKAEARAKA